MAAKKQNCQDWSDEKFRDHVMSELAEIKKEIKQLNSTTRKHDGAIKETLATKRDLDTASSRVLTKLLESPENEQVHDRMKVTALKDAVYTELTWLAAGRNLETRARIAEWLASNWDAPGWAWKKISNYNLASLIDMAERDVNLSNIKRAKPVEQSEAAA